MLSLNDVGITHFFFVKKSPTLNQSSLKTFKVNKKTLNYLKKKVKLNCLKKWNWTIQNVKIMFVKVRLSNQYNRKLAAN